jgi:hypothetical protein
MMVGGSHAAENHWRDCHFPVRSLSDRRAPGLEQKYGDRSHHWAGIHSAVRCRRGLGREDGVWNIPMAKVRDVGNTKPAVAKNAFAGQAKKPSEGAVASVLGPTLPLWRELVADLKRELKIDTAEWHSGAVKCGWSLRLQLKKRNIVYLAPCEGFFQTNFALGDRAVAAAKKSDLRADVLKIIADSRRYAEGTAVRIRVTKPEDLVGVKKLAKIKIEN